MSTREDTLVRLGFRFEPGGAHLARSMMLGDLRRLLACVPEPTAGPSDFAKATVDENCLGKRSLTTRKLALRHLRSLYALDPSVPLYRVLRHLWSRDPEAQPLLAGLIAFARDPMLRSSAPFIAGLAEGTPLDSRALEAHLDEAVQSRLSRSTLVTLGQHVATTWAHAGRLAGSLRKTRSHARPTPGAVTLALLLGYVRGTRGMLLLETEYTELLDSPPEQLLELAAEAARRGWLTSRRLGAVFEVRFPDLLTPDEEEWIREQG